MLRRALMACTLTALAAVVFAGPPATLVLKNGERHSGTFVYHKDNNFTLQVDGQERTFPQSEVAILAFVPGDPGIAELNRLPQTDNPSELQRNMLVLRNGNVVHGKVYDFTNDGDTVIVDTTGGRQEFSVGDVARIYMSAPGARAVYRAPAGAPPVATTGSTAPGTIVVEATRPWTDTGITVRKGDRVSFHTSGQVEIAPGAAAGPDGFAGDTASRNRYPVPSLPAGGLMGRVGNSGPFPIGSNSDPITMPANGRLFLGINDTNYGDNGGAFSVSVVR